MKEFIVKKSVMKQVFDKNGKLLVATAIKVPDLFVVEKIQKEKAGYEALIIGAGNKKFINKSIQGKLKKAKIKDNLSLFKEVKGASGFELGEKIDVFKYLKPGCIVNISGRSKGRGFSGAIKRWGFSSQPKTHGASDRERAPGSSGPQTPGRVVKGKKMPGHYGNARRTIKNLKVIDVDEKNSVFFVEGGVPGHRNAWLLVKIVGENKNFVQLAKNEKEKAK